MRTTKPAYAPKVIRDNLAKALTGLQAARFQVEANGSDFWRDLLDRAIKDCEHIWKECDKPIAEE